jgi:serpin B
MTTETKSINDANRMNSNTNRLAVAVTATHTRDQTHQRRKIALNMARMAGKLAIIVALSFMIGSPPSARSNQLQSLVEGNTAFGLDLYGQLAATPGNLFFSPYSISTCLAMLYTGARGNTEKQMAQVLKFGTDQQQFSSSFGELQRQLEATRTASGIELDLANALWTQKGYPFLPAFLETAEAQYQANVNQVDFITEAVAVRDEINRWVAQETKDKIQNILPPGSLNALTRLVLANAIYFKGAWTTAFEETNTVTQPFYVSSTNQVDAPLMHQPLVSVNYMATSDFQAVELPYGSNQLASMVILLPGQIDGYGQLEKRLSPAFLSSALAQMRNQEVEIFLPRFTLAPPLLQLNNTLVQMGMPDAFTPGVANLSGIDGTTWLHITFVLHKAWGEVNEEGTEAAAATVVGGGGAAGGGIFFPYVFRADHPFIFFIRDTQSGSLLFLGRLADPST